MGVLVACNNEEEQIINEAARVVTTLFIDFSDAHGQLTHTSLVRFQRGTLILSYIRRLESIFWVQNFES